MEELLSSLVGKAVLIKTVRPDLDIPISEVTKVEDGVVHLKIKRATSGLRSGQEIAVLIFYVVMVS